MAEIKLTFAMGKFTMFCILKFGMLMIRNLRSIVNNYNLWVYLIPKGNLLIGLNSQKVVSKIL